MFSAYTLRQLRDDVSVMAGEKESRANIDGYCHSTSGRMRDYWHDALEIKETADKGRGVFAKEKLKAGTVVCRSLPLAACLKLNTRDKETGTFSNEYCAACFKSSQRLGAPPYTLCGACTQYFCSQACKSHSNHACELTSRIVSRLKETFKGEERELKLRNVALAFRILNTPSVCCCVHTQIVAEAGSGNGTDRGTKAHDLPSKLCERHPSAKVRLAGLYCGEGSAGEIQARLAFGDSELNECKDLMQRFATDAGKNSSPEISGRRENVEGCFVKGFLTIIRQIELNAFTVIDDRQRSVGAALYLNPSLFNHSCVPNLFALYNTDFSSPPLPTSSPCSAATTDGVTGVWQELKLLRDVEAGEELMHSYCDLARPRFERKAMLLKNYHFSCACSACSVAPSSGRRVDGRLIWKNLAESLEKANEEVTAKGIDPYYASDRMTRIREALCKVEGTDFDMELNLNRQGDCRVVDRSLPCYAEDLTRDVNRKYPFTSCSCDTVCSCLGIDDGGHRWLQQQCALLDSERARLRLEMPEPHLLNAETNVKATLELLHVFFRVWKGCEARLGFFNLSKYSILSEVYSLALDAGEDVLALELLPDIIAVQKAIYQPVPRHPLPLLLLQTLADLLAANGAEKAAAHLNARLLPDLSIVFGPHHPFTEHCSKGAL